jgi:hypothetical protein
MALNFLEVTACVKIPAFRNTLAEKHVTKVLKCFTISAAPCTHTHTHTHTHIYIYIYIDYIYSIYIYTVYIYIYIYIYTWCGITHGFKIKSCCVSCLIDVDHACRGNHIVNILYWNAYVISSCIPCVFAALKNASKKMCGVEWCTRWGETVIVQLPFFNIIRFY